MEESNIPNHTNHTATSFRAAIFDLDGVIVDTAEHHFLAWKRLADELGINFDREKNERLKGVSRLASLAIILENCPEPDEDRAVLADRKNGYYVEMIQQLTPADALPGVEAMLRKLRDHGIKAGVASASKNAKPVLKLLALEGLFDAIMDGFSAEKPKPAPDIFLHCAEALQTPPEECIVLEDAQAGIDAARAAGMFTVGVCKPGRLTGADMYVASTSHTPLTLWGCGGDSAQTSI
jgi:beta-phosphoglucomutase